MIHELKTWCAQYDAIEKGEKTFDYNSNDIVNNLRWDISKSLLGIKFTTGFNIADINYDNSTYQVVKYNNLFPNNTTPSLGDKNIINYRLSFRSYNLNSIICHDTS